MGVLKYKVQQRKEEKRRYDQLYWERLRASPQRYAMRLARMREKKAQNCGHGMMDSLQKTKAQKRESNKRYWDKLKEDPVRFARWKEANMRNNKRFRMKRRIETNWQNFYLDNSGM
ncbi:hypothetical protein ACOMHN_036053 [Nucella lapillus]